MFRKLIINLTTESSRSIHYVNQSQRYASSSSRSIRTLSPRKVTELLSANQVHLESSDKLPHYVKHIECNQLASNSPIEDRLRISSINLPGSHEPTLILGVFDGHGGGTTADLISRRLFNYIALALHPEPSRPVITNDGQFGNLLVDLHNSPDAEQDANLQVIESSMLKHYQHDLTTNSGRSANGSATKSHQDIVTNLKGSFKRCDEDLSREIQANLIRSTGLNQRYLRHYMSAAVSGCCAIVMVIQDGFAFLASTGDCRAVLGTHERTTEANINLEELASSMHHKIQTRHPKMSTFKALELNDEHNCDNINEVRRLAVSHPKSEQNTMIKHNRLLGHLMPFRAFGDFTYKWPADVIKACGITRAFGPGVIPANYETPPYLIVEPDVTAIQIDSQLQVQGAKCDGDLSSEQMLGNLTEIAASHDKHLIMATDGLWELFESSRDVVETIVDHSMNASHTEDEGNNDYDENCATYMLRSALRSGPNQDIAMDQDRLRQLYHKRLEATLTLPESDARNFRDDISIILLKLQ